MSFEWKIYARDANFARQGEIDEYKSARLIPVYNDVGTWELQVDRRSDQAAALTTPGWGIVVTRTGASGAVFSGPIVSRHHVVSTSEQTITIGGVTDDVWLKRRLVSPSPAESAPPYSQAYDAQTGTASSVLRHYIDVNAGPSAILTRQIPGLTIAADPVIGSSVSGNGRWDNLLTFLQTLATAGGVGFRIVQVGTGLQFQVYAGTDRTGTAKFSIPLGTLAGFDYQSIAPTGNYIYVGGLGSGTSRVFAEYPDSNSIATWGRIEGDFVDRGDTSDTAQMQSAAADAQARGAEQTSLSITPLERPGLRYGVDYFLGDKVSVQADDLIQDLVRTVEITLTPQGPQTVRPGIGTARSADVFRQLSTFRTLAALAKRITNVERR